MLAACLDTNVDYAGKRCSVDRSCPTGLLCSSNGTCQLTSAGGGEGGSGTGGGAGGAAGGGADGGCEVLPVLSCTLRDVPLAPGATPLAQDLMPGTRFVLQNADYPGLHLGGSGAPGCPIVVAGPARLTDWLTLDGSHVWVVDVTFAVPQELYALATAPGATDLDLRRLHFSQTAVGRPMNTSEFPFDVFLEAGCGDVTIAESDFTGTRAPAIFADPSCGQVTVKGNRFRTDADGPTIQLENMTGTVEGNELWGAMGFSAVQFVNGGAGVVRRNFFHDLTSSTLVAVRGAQQVVSNTFVNLAGAAASCGTFKDNAVVRTAGGVQCATEAHGYNLYDQAGVIGTLDATDKTGTAQLGTDGVPLSGSPAIDAADPALPVPLGGGTRADIGAFERGATRSPDGTYCTQ
jgi:hypothetical protein